MPKHTALMADRYGVETPHMGAMLAALHDINPSEVFVDMRRVDLTLWYVMTLWPALVSKNRWSVRIYSTESQAFVMHVPDLNRDQAGRQFG